mgnify:CR=1 FL=1
MADLITLQEYKDAKGISSPKLDDKLPFLIAAASQYIKNYISLSLVDNINTPVVEYFDGTNTDRLLLTEFPLISIVSVGTSTDNAETFTTLDPTLYYTDECLGAIYSVPTRFAMPCGNTKRSVRVEYLAGYGVEDVGNPGTYLENLPDDIKLATIELVAHYLKEDWTPRRSQRGSSEENVTVGSTLVVPIHIKRLLDIYRRL